MSVWRIDLPERDGWYLCRDETGLRVRAFGKERWWTDLGRGNGLDGWATSIDPIIHYEWIGWVGDVEKDKPSVPQAVRNLNPDARDVVMREAVDVYTQFLKEVDK